MSRRAQAQLQRWTVMEDARAFMENNFQSIIRLVKGHATDSTGGGTTDESHIIYFGPFMKHLFKFSNISINPHNWALAFIQEDLESTVRQLCLGIDEALMNLDPHEKRERFRASVGIIKNAAMWMMQKREKNLDPWEFALVVNNEGEIPTPTEEQTEFMNNVIISQLGLDKFDVNLDFEILQEIPSGGYNSFQNELGLPEQMDWVAMDGILSDALERTEDAEKFEEAFNIVMNLMDGKVHMASVADILTKISIPQNNDIFVDAVQISNKRFTRAGTERTLKDLTIRLVTQFVRRDIVRPNKPFFGVQDFCPVKRLAVYRSAKFLMHVCGLREPFLAANTTDFCSMIREHNMYPTWDEIMEIDAGIMESVEIERRTGNHGNPAGVGIPNFGNSTRPPSGSNHQNDLNLDAALNNMNLDDEQELMELLLPNMVPQPAFQAPSSPPLAGPLHRNAERIQVDEEELRGIAREIYRNNGKYGLKKAVKYLFHRANIFTEQQRRECTLSDREDRPQLPVEGINVIYRILSEVEVKLAGSDLRKKIRQYISELSCEYRKANRNP